MCGKNFNSDAYYWSQRALDLIEDCSFSAHLLIGAKDEVGRERRLASRAGRSRSQRDNSVRIGVPGLD